MLSDVELETLFNELGTPLAGRRLVCKARKESPVRQVRSNLSNLITRYPSRKMGRVVETESHTVEFLAMLRYEWDPTVLEYYAQPVEIDQKVTTPEGNVTRLHHTPDFLLIKRDGIVIEEWREEVRLLKLAMANPKGLLREQDGWRSPLAEAFFANLGLEYRLRSADELPHQYIQNLYFLETYLDLGNPNLEEQELETIRKVFHDKPAVYLRHLLSEPGLSSDAIYKAIADRVVAFDLDNDNLGETDRVSVYRDAVTMTFLQQSMAPVVGLPQERLDSIIEPGGKIVMNNKEYEILFVEAESIAATCQGKTHEFSLAVVEKLHQQGQLQLLPDPNGANATKVDASRLGNYSPAQLDLALKRATWIEQATIAPNTVPCSSRTLQRYRRAARIAGDSILDRNLALVPKHFLKGNRKRRIQREILDLISDIAREKFNKPDNISVRTGYLHFVSACESLDLEPCSMKCFSRELQKRKSTKLRQGKRIAYQEGRFVNYLHIRSEVHGVRPFQMVHIDHTELQVLLCLPNSRESLGRAYLTLAIDAESRAVVGFYLTFDPPGYRACMMVMRDIVRRYGRLPEMLVLDNGKEFHSKAMMRLCALYGVSIRYRPSGQPRAGCIVERSFDTTQSQLINQLAGNTQVLRYVRSVTKQVMPENFVTWTLPGLHAALDYYFIHLYGEDPHPAHHDGPVEHLHRRLKETGERRRRLVAYDRRFLVETCPSPIDRDTRVVNGQRGVKINHLYYHCEAFNASALDGKSVEVRVDPWDIRFVYALVGDQWHRCANNRLARYRSYTEVELRYVLEEELKRTRKKDFSPARVAEWLLVLDPCNWDARLKVQRAKQSECRSVYESLGMTNIEPMGPEVDQPVPHTTGPKRPRPVRRTEAQLDEPASNSHATRRSSHWSQEDNYDLL